MAHAQLIQVQFQSSRFDGQQARNTFHVQHDGGDLDLAALQTLAAAFVDQWGGTYAGVLANGWTLDFVNVQQTKEARVVGDAPVEWSEAADIDGTRSGTGDAAPEELCALLSLKTGLASRRFRGRQFMPPAEFINQVNGENVKASSTYETNVNALAAKYDQLISGHDHPEPFDGFDLVVYSRVADVVAAPNFYARVSTIVFNRRIHWLRSRGR